MRKGLLFCFQGEQRDPAQLNEMKLCRGAGCLASVELIIQGEANSKLASMAGRERSDHSSEAHTDHRPSPSIFLHFFVHFVQVFRFFLESCTCLSHGGGAIMQA